MTTYQEARGALTETPTVRERSALLRGFRALSGAIGDWSRRNKHRARLIWANVIALLFDLAGVGLLSAAGWLLHPSAGLALLGVGAMVLGHTYSERVRGSRE